MLSTNDIADWINGKVCKIIPGLKYYGVGKTAINSDGKQQSYINGQYIGIDDTYSAMLYHKDQSVASTTVPGSGYGNDERSLQNTYTMAMIVYFNEKKCGVMADTLYTFIQSTITGVLKAQGYKSIRVNVQSAILNDAQVWRQEYGNTPYQLSDAQRLLQINYNVVFVFDKNCIAINNC